jgi:hypothetical protein
MRLIDGCEFRGRRDGAAIVVCPPGLGDETLRQVGRVASQGERACTVWFWADPALAPEAPPTPERPMSEAQADAAVAVYLAGTDRLCLATRDERAA